MIFGDASFDLSSADESSDTQDTCSSATKDVSHFLATIDGRLSSEDFPCSDEVRPNPGYYGNDLCLFPLDYRLQVMKNLYLFTKCMSCLEVTCLPIDKDYSANQPSKIDWRNLEY